MRLIKLLACALALGVLVVCGLAASVQTGATTPLEVPGRTRCMISHRGIIAPAILRPVVEVLVEPGRSGEKRPGADQALRSRAAGQGPGTGEGSEEHRGEGPVHRRNLELAENSRGTGAIPKTTYNEIRATALSNEAQVLAAEAELALVQSEFKLYSVTAAIDGEIAWLDVSPGTVSWPGSLIWGEIVDLRELDVRCELSPIQAEQVAVGQPAEVWLEGKNEAAGTGKVVLVGKQADRNSGIVPVVIRLANPQERLRAEVPVKVRFLAEKGN